MKAWYFDVVSELELKNEYSPQKVLGINPNVQYSFKRCLIESVEYGQDAFVSEGVLSQKTIVDPHGNSQVAISNNVLYEGWKHF